MEKRKGFTLIELMVVILIVSILAGVAIPLMQGRIDAAKWSEANAAAGTIRTAVRAYFAEDPVAAQALSSASLGTDTVRNTLGFNVADLTGTYFAPANYTIDSVDASGHATISVSAGTGLTGSYTLNANGTWVKGS